MVELAKETGAVRDAVKEERQRRESVQSSVLVYVFTRIIVMELNLSVILAGVVSSFDKNTLVQNDILS